MNLETPSVDVVTLTHDHPEYLVRAIFSMDTQDVEYTGWVVNNSETKAGQELSQEIAHQFGWTEMTRGKNLTFSVGNNWGASMGRGEYILLLNDDAVLSRDCVKSMLEHQGDVVGALLLNDDGTVNHGGVRCTMVDERTGDWQHIGRGEEPAEWYGLCGDIDAVTFAVVLIKRIVWDALGGLEEMYEWSFEDTDFCLKAWEAGYRVEMCRQAMGVHNEFGTRTKDNDVRNATILAGKWIATGKMNDLLPTWGWIPHERLVADRRNPV